MEYNAHFDVLSGHHRKLVVELSRLLVVEDKQKFVNKEEDDVECEREGVQDWHASWEHKNTPEVCVVQSINVVPSNLISCVKLLELILENLFCIDAIVTFFQCLNFLVGSIVVSHEELD